MENLKIRKAMALILIITILMINSLNLLNGIVVAYDENQEVQEDDRFNKLIENIDTEVKQEVVKFTKVNENSVLLQQNVMVKSNNSLFRRQNPTDKIMTNTAANIYTNSL